MGSGKAVPVLHVSCEVSDNRQNHAQYCIRNVHIVPEASFHIQGVIPIVLSHFPFCIKKMVPSIGEPYKKRYYRHRKKQESHPDFQRVDRSGIQKSDDQP